MKRQIVKNNFLFLPIHQLSKNIKAKLSSQLSNYTQFSSINQTHPHYTLNSFKHIQNYDFIQIIQPTQQQTQITKYNNNKNLQQEIIDKKISKSKTKNQNLTNLSLIELMGCTYSLYSIIDTSLQTLTTIIKDIYAMKTNFQNQKQLIEECMKIQTIQGCFSQFINNTIRNQVQKIKKQIDDNLGKINFQTIDFSIVSKLFDQFSIIKQASTQVQKIINVYLHKISDQSKQYFKQKKLDDITFKFILGDQSSKEKLGFFFQTIRADTSNKIEKEKQMINSMIQMLREVDLDDNDVQTDDYSTSHSSQGYQDENQIEIQKIETKKLKKKSKKKNKTNQKLYQSDFENILLRLQFFQIQEDRRQCNVSQQWIINIENKITYNLRKTFLE